MSGRHKITSIHFIFLFFVQVSKDSPKKTRRSFGATNYLDNCFCDKNDRKLYSCATKLLNKHVNKWAVYMQDRKLLAKLNEGDMAATETTKIAL